MIGTEKAKDRLLQALKKERLASSLLFIGPQDSGKTLIAKYLAKSVNCLQGNGGACGSCSSCERIENSTHPDVHWIESDESGTIKIDVVRQMERQTQLRPYEGRQKVFIIEEASRLTVEAGNALLKTLEEPPKDTLIILTTAHADQLLPTILSRCQKFLFPTLKSDELPTDSLARHNAFLEAFLNPAINERYFGSDLFEDRARLKENLNFLLGWFRDILMLKVGMERQWLINRGRESELERMRFSFDFLDLLDIMSDITAALALNEQNVNTKVSFAVLRAKIVNSDYSD
ncbi:MAG: DNA polymerase III subunit delta' [Candidatus Omnitrophota bacterium]